MATLTITLPDNIKERVYKGVAAAHRYRTEIPNPAYDSMYDASPTNLKMLPNPESRDDFVTRMVKDFIMRSVQKAESDTARETAEKSAKDEVAL